MFLLTELILKSAFLMNIFQIYVAAASVEDDNMIVVGSSNGTQFKDDGCHYLLQSFAQVSANFTFCSITNARPITLCQGCVDSYTLAVGVHRDISKLMNTAGELCREKLLNLDRLQVVEGGFGFISGLWKRAECDYCYELDSEGNPTRVKTLVQEIVALHNETNSCIQRHINDTEDVSSTGGGGAGGGGERQKLIDPSVCDACKSVYLEMNSQYNHYKDVTPFCMDIIDMVNKTRQLWSGTLGCCQDRQKPEVTFLLMSGIISVLPVLFYLIACRFTGRKERIVAMGSRCIAPYLDGSGGPGNVDVAADGQGQASGAATMPLDNSASE